MRVIPKVVVVAFGNGCQQALSIIIRQYNICGLFRTSLGQKLVGYESRCSESLDYSLHWCLNCKTWVVLGSSPGLCLQMANWSAFFLVRILCLFSSYVVFLTHNVNYWVIIIVIVIIIVYSDYYYYQTLNIIKLINNR